MAQCASLKCARTVPLRVLIYAEIEFKIVLHATQRDMKLVFKCFLHSYT